MRIIITLAFIALSCCAVIGQSDMKAIRGSVRDTHNKPLPNATLVLIRLKDSAFHKTQAADDQGGFEFKVPDGGTYQLVVTNVGYARYASQPISVTANSGNVVLPAIFLQPAEGVVLKDVAVKARLPLVEQRIDRLVVNVDAFITNAGSNALEVLAKSPGVVVDIDGDISLNGRSGVLVLIDNKPTYLSTQGLATYLRSISSSTLDRIELMSNPPARYDASGRAIINIILKKNKVKGFNGNVSAGYNQGVYGKVNDAVNFNYRDRKFNFFGNFSYNEEKNYEDESNNRYYYNADGSPNSTVLMESQGRRNTKSFSGRAGIDYFPSSKTTWGLVINGGTRPRRDRDDYISHQYDADMKLDSISTGYTNKTYKWKNGGVNLNFQHRFDSTGKEISVDLDYVGYWYRGNQTSPNYVSLPDGTVISSTDLINIYPTDISVYSAKADYTHPLSKQLRFDAGIKARWARTDNSTEYYNQAGNAIIQDYGKSNRFIYRENVNAAYVNISREWRRWGVQAGLRMENTISQGHQPGTMSAPDSSFEKNYTNLFPTFYLSYKLDSSGNNTIVLSYGKRISRPNYQQLNPFLVYHDQYTYTAGNPYLNASYNYHVELSYRYKHYLIFAPFYDRIDGIMVASTKPTGNVFITRPENIAYGYMFGASANLSWSPARWWNTNLNVYLFHVVNRGLLYTEYLDQKLTRGGFSLVNQFRFGKTWTGELSGSYGGKMIAGQTIRGPIYIVNAGLQKTIWRDKGTIKLKMDDIFHSLVFKVTTTNIQQAAAFYTRETDSRIVGILLTYRFGKLTNARKRNHVTGVSDEDERAGN